MKKRRFALLLNVLFLIPLLVLAEKQWPPQFKDTSISNAYVAGDQDIIASARAKFESAVHDTTRYAAIYMIIENLMSNDWEIYNEWMLQEMENVIRDESLSEQEVKFYTKIYAITLGNKGLIYSNTGDFDLALEFLGKALELNKKLNNTIKIANDFNNIGFTYSKKGDALMALEFYKSALHIREGLDDKKGTATALNNIGFIYQRIGDKVKGIEYYERALKLREEAGDKWGIANSFHNLAAINQEQGNGEQALVYYNKSLSIREEIGDKKGLALTLNNIGFIHKENGKLKEANEYYKRSYYIYEGLGDRPGQVVALHNLGATCIEEKDWECASANLDLAWEMNEDIGDEYSAAGLLQLMANMEVQLGNIKAGEEKALKAIEIATKEHYTTIIQNVSQTLVEIYKRQGKWDKRFKYYELYIQTRDSLKNDATQKAAISQSLRYEYEKAEVERAKEQAIKDAIAHKELILQRILSSGITLFLVFAIAFSWIIWNRLKITRKQKAIIEKQKEEIQDSINYARRIQVAILPPLRLIGQNVESFVYFRPKDVVAGDFYWFVENLPYIYFAAADCTGHGVPGAMVSVVCNNALNRTVNEYNIEEPAEILNKVRELVAETFEQSDEDVKDGMDIALCRLNIKTKTLSFSGAHNPLYIISQQSQNVEEKKQGEDGLRKMQLEEYTLTEYKGDKMPIGKYARQRSFSQHDIQLKEGDVVYVSSDGFADQFGGPKGRKFMYKPFKQLLLEIHQKPVAMQKEILNANFEEWKGEMEQIDDVCVMGIKV